jgi:signal transduction histidine kinase
VVTVSLKRRPEGIELSVADNGHGVPEAQREHIFKRFYRVERSRTATGNGLGLSIVAAVAELHAAKLSASDNDPGLKIAMLFSEAAYRKN